MPSLNRYTFRQLTGCFIALLYLSGCGSSLPEEVQAEYDELPEYIDYNFHVKPILADRCYSCHGPDENTRKAGLRLDIEEDALAVLTSGSRAIVPKKLSKSSLYHRILSANSEEVMPPPDSKLSLNDEEKAVLVKWIEQGAEWKQHWSFIEVERPEVPETPNEWVNNPIDQFVLARLDEVGLDPAPQAEKERLIRRVTMDLTGLPPTIEEVESFLNDKSANAYEKVVDRLLASEAHAERLTMEWLDVARYSDTHGVSFDGFRNSWPWRDWVISAFHENKPYDKFIAEQIAGDMLEDATKQQKIATSFLRMGQLEGGFGSIPEEFRVEYVLERTALTGTAFLGLTMECARCHDHKFDPISQKEYYQLSAFFNNTMEMGLAPLDGERAPTIYLFDSLETILLDSIELVINSEKEKFDIISSKVSSIKAYADDFEIPDKVADLRIYHFDDLSNYKRKNKDKVEEIIIADGNTKAVASEGVSLVEGISGRAAYFDDEYDLVSLEEAGLFDTYEAFSASAWIRTNREDRGPTQTILTNSNNYAADYRGWDLYLDSALHLRARLIHRLPDDYIEVMVPVPVKSQDWQHVGITYDGSGQAKGIDLYLNGRKMDKTVEFDHLTRSMLPISDFTLDTISLPLQAGRSYRFWTFDVGLFDGAIDEISLAERQLSSLEMAILANSSEDIDEEMIREHRQLNSDELLRQRLSLAEALTSKKNILDTVMQIMVMEEMDEPRKSHVLNRGVYDEPLDEVTPGTPQQVLAFGEEFEQNRLGLARWITDRKNPLTARVAINRYWQMLFGKGLVKTAEDFGIQGALPSHPELLDWMAAEFMESGWDLRHMLKLMVMSSTYRQSSRLTDELLEKDPQNIYYARGSSYRWPAEFLRDNALAASGLLVDEVGGPPIKTYQPEGLWKELEFNSYLGSTYKKDTLDKIYRRSLYIFQRRFIPPPFMSTFDASTREFCEVRRDVTNSPLQALALLNEPQIVEASRILAERILHEEKDLENQLTFGYRLSTGIKPTGLQMNIMKDQYRANLEYFRQNTGAADSLLSIGDRPWDSTLDKQRIAAMSMVASTIFNYDDYYMKR